VSKVSFPCSSIVTAASLAKVTPEENGWPGLLTESSYLICTLLIEILRFPIIVEIRELSHEFPEDGLPNLDLDIASSVADSASN
jgi:hypothetical protein